MSFEVEHSCSALRCTSRINVAVVQAIMSGATRHRTFNVVLLLSASFVISRNINILGFLQVFSCNPLPSQKTLQNTQSCKHVNPCCFVRSTQRRFSLGSRSFEMLF